MSSLYADATGKGSLAAVEMAVADYGGKVKGKPVEVVSADHQNKPDVGVSHRAQLVRQREGRCDLRRADLLGRAADLGADPREEQDQHQFRRRQFRHHRRRLLAQHGALDLRHLCAVQRRRQGDGQARRGHLVLRHRRLRLRHGAGTRRRQRRQGERRQGARRRPPPPELVGLLLVPAAGAGLQGQGRGAGQCRRRHHQRAEAGRPNSASPRAARR